MQQFTVITKDGIKWLRPVLNPSDTDQLSRFFQNAGDGFEDLPYIGSHPEGTAVYESEVREVRQFKDNGEWVETSYENYMEDDELGLPVRIAYTDSEPHYRHIRSALPLLNLCADEMRAVEYWKKRAEAAEKLIGISPSDPKVYDEFCRIREEWEQIIAQNAWS